MAGNVYEWCLTEWGTDSVLLIGGESRVVRGGSIFNNQLSAGAAFRNLDLPGFRGGSIGFRVVCRPPSL